MTCKDAADIQSAAFLFARQGRQDFETAGPAFGVVVLMVES